jgi:hypothetical protein
MVVCGRWARVALEGLLVPVRMVAVVVAVVPPVVVAVTVPEIAGGCFPRFSPLVATTGM